MKGGSSRVVKGWKRLGCKRLEAAEMEKVRSSWVVEVLKPFEAAG